MRGWAQRWLVFAFTALVMTAACKKSPNKISDDGGQTSTRAPLVRNVHWVVPAVNVEVHSVSGRKVQLDGDSLGRRLDAGLKASGLFVAVAGNGESDLFFEPARVAGRLSYDVIDEGSTGSPAIIVALEVALLPADPRYLALHDNVIVERVILDGESSADVDEAIAARAVGAIDASIDGIVSKERLRTGSADELREAIRGAPDLAVWALDVVADRGESSLGGAVIEALGSRDPQVASAAIAAAVALKERAAVGPMTRVADFQDYEGLRVLIEAMSVLGGDEAMEFLEFVATGHPDSEIKSRAREALGRLRP